MSFTIAIAGKGGTGKTTISALLVRLLRLRKTGSLLGIDADPNSNLGELLGCRPHQTIGTVLDEVAAHPDSIPAGMTKERFIEYQVQTIIQESEGFDLLTMGKPEGPGCYCYVNNVLRGVTARLIKDYSLVVIDNEAGLEHLSRKTTAQADVLLVVSDGTAAGLRAAKRIAELVVELKIKARRRCLLLNRLDRDMPEEKLSGLGLEYAGRIPEDKHIMEVNVRNEPVFNVPDSSPALKALEAIVETLTH